MNSRHNLSKAAPVLLVSLMVLAAVVSCSKENERTNPYEVWCWTLTPTHTSTTVPTPLPTKLVLKGEGGSYEGCVNVADGVVTAYTALGMTVAVSDYQIGYLSFDISALPPMTNIVGVELWVKTNWASSVIQFLGDLMVDHVSHDTLGAEDLLPGATGALHAGVGQTTASVNSNWIWMAIDPVALEDDIANARPRSQYRLRFTVQDYNGTGAVGLSNGNNADPDIHDELVIYYY